MTPQLRRARWRDLPTLAALERAAFSYPWRWGEIIGAYLPGGKILIAAVDDAVAGYVVCLGRRLARLAVFPQYRRQGVGRALVQAVLRPGLRLQVREGNHAARALYAEAGFHEVRACRYRDGESGWVLVWRGATRRPDNIHLPKRRKC